MYLSVYHIHRQKNIVQLQFHPLTALFFRKYDPLQQRKKGRRNPSGESLYALYSPSSVSASRISLATSARRRPESMLFF